MINIINYVSGTLIKPKKTYDDVINDPDSLKTIWIFLIIIGCLFTVSNLAYYLTGMEPGLPPIVRITGNNFFLWVVIAGNPALVFLFIMVPGIIKMLADFLKGNGTYTKTFTVSSLSIAVPFLLYWIFEVTFLIICLVKGITSPPGFTMYIIIAAMGLTMIYNSILLSIASYAAQKYEIWKAIVSGILSSVVFWFFAIVFIG